MRAAVKHAIAVPQITVPERVTAVEKPHASGDELSERQLFLFVALSAVVFVATVSALGQWNGLVSRYGDNAAYAQVASAIRAWDFRSMGVQHFQGYPYCIATVSSLLRVSPMTSLWMTAWAASFIAVFVTARLFGAWTAAYFALTNFAWLQRSFLGGSEPLAMALGLGALLAFRRRATVLAAVLGSLAVTVRPLMIFVLIGVGVVLLYQKRLKEVLIAGAISLLMGFLYVLPLAYYFGDPLLTIHTYTERDYGAANISGPHGHLFGWPFHGIVAGTMAYPDSWSNLLLSFFWIALVLAGIGAMFSERFREYARSHPNESIFCGLYLLAVFSYDYLVWARAAFIRFSIPALPFVFYALLQWLPKKRWILVLLAAISPILAACSALGIRNVVRLLQ